MIKWKEMTKKEKEKWIIENAILLIVSALLVSVVILSMPVAMETEIEAVVEDRIENAILSHRLEEVEENNFLNDEAKADFDNFFEKYLEKDIISNENVQVDNVRVKLENVEMYREFLGHFKLNGTIKVQFVNTFNDGNSDSCSVEYNFSLYVEKFYYNNGEWLITEFSGEPTPQ